MHSPTSIADRSEQPYISTGHLPDPELVQRLVSEAHARFKSNTEGQNSQIYPALARVPSDLFGVCVVGTSGRVYAAGDVDYPFSIMSVSKPFVFGRKRRAAARTHRSRPCRERPRRCHRRFRNSAKDSWQQNTCPNPWEWI